MICFVCGNKFKRCLQLYNRLTICQECFKQLNGYKCKYCQLLFLNNKNNNVCDYCIKYQKVRNDLFVHNYFFKPYPTFYKVKDQEDLYFGIQLQIGQTTKKNVNYFSVHNQDNFFYIKYDSTIPEFGCQVVSYPATLQYHQSDLNNWKTLLKNANKLLFKSDQIDNCGLHIHINRDYFLFQQIRMIDYFVNNNVQFFEQFSNRTSKYARFLKKPLFLYGFPINYKRHCALNLLNKNTIQFRMFKSTLKYQQLMSKIQFLYLLSKYVQQFNDFNQFIENQNVKSIFELNEKYQLKYTKK